MNFHSAIGSCCLGQEPSLASKLASWESSRPANQIKPAAAFICILSCQKQSHSGQGDSHQFTLFMRSSLPNEFTTQKFQTLQRDRYSQESSRGARASLGLFKKTENRRFLKNVRAFEFSMQQQFQKKLMKTQESRNLFNCNL